jgi:hypothetical protein
MSQLHAVAATVERVAQGIERRLLDSRRFTVDQAFAALHAAMLPANPTVADPDLLRGAVKLVQDDYAAVRQSTRFCCRYDGDTVRVEHCASGIYLFGYRRGEITHQWIHNLEVNLEDGQGWLESRACPTDPRRACPYLHLHVPPWSSWSRKTTGGDTTLGVARTLRYIHLGIGTAVYQRAANIVPNARWTAGNLFEDSKALRRSLHREDPWRWEDPYCQICGKHFPLLNRLSWADGGRQLLAAAHRQPQDTRAG